MTDDVIPADDTIETARRIAIYLEQENARLEAMIQSVRSLADGYARRAEVAPSILLYAKTASQDILEALDGE